jgi:hypothetical protein
MSLDCNVDALQMLLVQETNVAENPKVVTRLTTGLWQLGHQCLKAEHFTICLHDIGKDIPTRKMSLYYHVDVLQMLLVQGTIVTKNPKVVTTQSLATGAPVV